MRRFTRRQFLKLSGSAAVGIALFGPGWLSRTARPGTPQAVPRTALYLDDSTWEGCRIATIEMLEWSRYPFETVAPDAIINRGLGEFDLLFMPGGDMYEHRQNLFPDGMLRIQQFVERGGGYVGICGGAFLAAEEMIWQGWDGEQLNYRSSGLGIFSGQAEGPIEDFAPDYIEMCRVNVEEPRHAITQLGPDVYWMEYHHGPLLTPSDPAEVTVIGRSERGEHPLLMACTHGAGRVFLSGSHPELAANADDGSDVTQVNWEWLSRAILWCGGAI